MILIKLLKETGKLWDGLPYMKGAFMTEEQSARLLPQKPSRWAKILLNRKVPILLFFLLELAFLSFHISVYKSISHPLSYGEHLLSVFTFFTCSIVPWILVPNCPG